MPDEIVNRRYRRGLVNLRTLYLPLADGWFLFDNSTPRPLLIAERQTGGDVVVHSQNSWKKING